MTTWHHDQRFAGVLAALQAQDARSVLDLGCGSGDFMIPLAAVPGISRVTGVEQSPAALARLRARLAEPGAPVVTVLEGSILQVVPGMRGHDAAVMIEVIEHLDPSHLSVLERVLFAALAPPTVILTTPNADFNPLLGVPSHRFRHPEHKFEWGRARFRAWAEGVAARAGYTVRMQDLAGAHPTLGGASQMAVFVKARRAPAPV